MLLYGLALLRGMGVILTFALFLTLYGITRIFVPHTKDSGFRLRRLWVNTIGYPLLRLKVSRKGDLHTGPALYVCNHRSFADPIIISKYLDAFIIAKAEVASYPVINKGAEVTGILYVQRDSQQSRSETRRAFVNVIKEGYNILVYPEGTISTNKSILPFKKGTFYESAAQGITVVPVALEYRDYRDLWTFSSFIKQYFQQFAKWSTEAKLSFGPAITSTDGMEIAEHCSSWIASEIAQMQEGWSRIDYDAVVRDYP